MDRQDRFPQRLQEMFENMNWRVQAAPGALAAACDLVVAADVHRYAVQINLANEPRRVLLEGQLASAILRARAAAAKLNAMPLAIVAAPFISKALLNELGDFAARYGDNTAWGAMDDAGLAIFHGPGLEGVRSEQRRPPRRRAAPQRADYLSDLGQWMLKVLFSRLLPFELRLEVPSETARLPPGTRRRIDTPIESAMALAKIARVSTASAARFVLSLRDSGFLDENEGFLQLIRIEQLLDQWRAAFKRHPPELRARWLFPPKDPQRHLDDAIRKPQQPDERACLGLFAACDRLGFRFVSGVVPYVYLEHMSNEALRRFGLRNSQPGEPADVIVRQPRYPESVFRGAVYRDGLAVADVLQCWLDVASNPARGDEMAKHLYDRVIAPNLLSQAA